MTVFSELVKLQDIQSFIFGNPFLVGSGLILIGFFGLVFSKKNIIILIMNIEVMLLGCGLNYLGFVITTGSIFSYSFAFFLLAFAAAEAAVGLGLVVNLFTSNKSLDLVKIGRLYG